MIQVRIFVALRFCNEKGAAVLPRRPTFSGTCCQNEAQASDPAPAGAAPGSALTGET